MGTADTSPAYKEDLPFQIIPLKDAKGFTNKEIPDFLNQNRGLPMKNLWQNLSAMGEINNLISATVGEIPSQTAYQYFSAPNRDQKELDRVPDVLQALLTPNGKVNFEYDLFNQKGAGFNGGLVFTFKQQVGEAIVTKEVVIELKLNQPYNVSYSEYAVIGPYEAERITTLSKDADAPQGYTVSDSRTLRFPSFSYVDIWTKEQGGKKVISVTDMSSQGWIHETRPSRKEIGVNFNGDLPSYFDRLIPKMTQGEIEPYETYAARTFTPPLDSFGKLFPRDDSLY